MNRTDILNLIDRSRFGRYEALDSARQDFDSMVLPTPSQKADYASTLFNIMTKDMPFWRLPIRLLACLILDQHLRRVHKEVVGLDEDMCRNWKAENFLRFSDTLSSLALVEWLPGRWRKEYFAMRIPFATRGLRAIDGSTSWLTELLLRLSVAIEVAKGF